MKLKKLLVWASAAGLSVAIAQAQETSEIDDLNRQLKQMQGRFEKQQRELREHFERLLREQQAQINSLKEQLEAGKTNGAAPAAAPVPPGPVATQPKFESPAAATRDPAVQPWSPAQPIRFGSGQSYFDLSFDALIAAGTSTANDIERLQPGGHDPNQRGFTVQNLETTFQGHVDPYFRGQANIIYQIDTEGESFLEVEEAFLETLSLPGNLQVKAGQFFTEFGRLNPQHPHAWDFVDLPLANARMFGGDGLRNPGGRLSWLLPTPFYSELYLAIQNSHGETAASFRNENEGELLFGRFAEQGSVRSFGDLLFVPRYAASFDLSDSQTLLTGASAAFGPNGAGGDTQIYGVDLFWKWKPVTHNKGFPFVAWQTEAMFRRFEADAFGWDLNADGLLDPDEQDADGDGVPDVLPRETLTDWGFYSQILWGIRPRWVAGLRGDFVTGETGDYERLAGRDLDRTDRWRISPNLSWYPSEFSKIRLQYNYDQRQGLSDDHSVWLQFEFLLGAHAAHKF